MKLKSTSRLVRRLFNYGGYPIRPVASIPFGNKPPPSPDVSVYTCFFLREIWLFTSHLLLLSRQYRPGMISRHRLEKKKYLLRLSIPPFTSHVIRCFCSQTSLFLLYGDYTSAILCCSSLESRDALLDLRFFCLSIVRIGRRGASYIRLEKL